MEEDKLIRMAAAISECTTSSMLQETVSEAAETLNQAASTVQTLPGIPQHLLDNMARAQQALEQLERSAVTYQKERTADAADTQKAIMQHRHLRGKEELESNFNSEP